MQIMMDFMTTRFLYIDYCPGNTRLNGGSCADLLNNYLCTCHALFFRKKCQSANLTVSFHCVLKKLLAVVQSLYSSTPGLK